MDYKDYKQLIERYNELDQEDFKGISDRKTLIRKLMDISYEKRQIQSQTNAIIREYIEKYEKSPILMNAEAEKMLNDFRGLLIPPGKPFLDMPITFRISKLLFQYYQATGNLEKTIVMLEHCAVFDVMLKEHLAENESSAYTLMAEKYLADFDKLSEETRRSLLNCWLLSVVNNKDMTFGLKKYREIKAQLEKISWNRDDKVILMKYIACKMHVLAYALDSCRSRESFFKNNDIPTSPMIDLEKEAPLIRELRDDLLAVLESEEQRSVVPDKVILRICCAQASYHLGEMSMEELLKMHDEYSQPRKEHNAMEQFTALFTVNSHYMNYLYKCSGYEKEYILNKSKSIIANVVEKAEELAHQFGNEQTNYFMLTLVDSASNIVDFGFVKSMVLNATIYANKALYVHTMMVKEISMILLKYILEHDPQYLDGVVGQTWEYHRDHKEECLELMKNCALFHDIGKSSCLDYVSNSARNLTDDEFEIIKEHPANYSKIYHGKLTPEMACIRDCALLHHLWNNGQGGYPREKHTENQPFVDILSIADSIDAATDNIGRPYGLGKTLWQLMEEFDRMKDTRYSAYICGLLHVKENIQNIEYVLNYRREDIYYEIYNPSHDVTC